jgi:hypothetical protein
MYKKKQRPQKLGPLSPSHALGPIRRRRWWRREPRSRYCHRVARRRCRGCHWRIDGIIGGYARRLVTNAEREAKNNNEKRRANNPPPNGSCCRLGVDNRSSRKIDHSDRESRSFRNSFADDQTTCRGGDGFPIWHEESEWRLCPLVMDPLALPTMARSFALTAHSTLSDDVPLPV